MTQNANHQASRKNNPNSTRCVWGGYDVAPMRRTTKPLSQSRPFAFFANLCLNFYLLPSGRLCFLLLVPACECRRCEKHKKVSISFSSRRHR
jgi:hypothetical protein